jgi:hypothetical protein
MSPLLRSQFAFARFCAVALVALGAAGSAAADSPIQLAEGPRGTGVGIILGEPTGLSMAWRADGPSTFDAALAWSVPESRVHLHADYLYELVSFRDPAAPVVDFPVYIGVGPRLHLGDVPTVDSSVIGIRVPVGLGVQGIDKPFEGFFELVPVLGLYPRTRMDFDAALGVRVYLDSRLEAVKRNRGDDEPASTWDQIEAEDEGKSE